MCSLCNHCVFVISARNKRGPCLLGAGPGDGAFAAAETAAKSAAETAATSAAETAATSAAAKPQDAHPAAAHKRTHDASEGHTFNWFKQARHTAHAC